ncbi:MAG: hypothetical protein NVSMB5_25050 [Candidatus Velthaea sp.]
MNDEIPAVRPDIELRRVADEVLVHDRAGAIVHVLNSTAGTVLELCNGARSVGDIAGIVRASAEDPKAPVERDVQRILTEFAALNLVDLR